MNAIKPVSKNDGPAVSITPSLIRSENLSVAFATDEGYCEAITDVTCSVGAGESVGLVGESGSGKSVTCGALLGQVAPGGRVVQGRIYWEESPIFPDHKHARALKSVRGRKMVTIPQDPMTALDPVFTVGYQITEVCRNVGGMSRKSARGRAIELLELVGVPSSATRLSQYPHEFSGGMQQRVLIAMALAAEPELIIADEPTTALDVTVQSQILDLLRSLKESLGLALLLVTHDLGVVAEVCDRILVMYSGRIVEEGDCRQIFNDAQHPYTKGLLASTPRIDLDARGRLTGIPGSPPTPFHRPNGCAFRPRCPDAIDKCLEVPMLEEVTGRRVACWVAQERNL